METRTERRKRIEMQRRREAARIAALCLAIAALAVVAVGATVTGRSAGIDAEEPVAVPQAPPAMTDGEMLQLSETITEPVVREWPKEEVEAIAKTVYGESAITGSDKEMAAVAWCILNRVDSPAYPDSIMEVITANRQFHGYNEEHPVDQYIVELVVDVLNRWDAEKSGEQDVGRVLPAEYLFFWGDGWHNHFTTEYLSGDEWDWSLPTPYDT